MVQQYQQLERKPLLCKWCKKIEITFSKSKVSQSGKMIPLNIHGLEPHKCSSNPYNAKQQPRYTSLPNQVQQESSSSGNQKEPAVQIQEQATNTLLHEILFEINELKKEIQELKKSL